MKEVRPDGWIWNYTFRQVQEILEYTDRLCIPLADSGLAANISVPESRKVVDLILAGPVVRNIVAAWSCDIIPMTVREGSSPGPAPQEALHARVNGTTHCLTCG